MLNRFSHYFFNKFRENETEIHELNYLFWECTQRCNLNCKHCGSDCSADSKLPDMPFEDFLNAILPLNKLYPRDSITVVITGGEPLLRNDLAECGKALRKNGFRWGIVSNGLAYNSEIHSKLLSAGMGAITISLDGLEDSHNWLRHNSKSFDGAIKAISLIASSARLSYDVVSCINLKNLHELPRLQELLISLGVKAWRLFTIAPIGRARGNQDLQLSREQQLQLMDFIVESRHDKRMEIQFSCEAYVGPYEKKVRDSYFFCRAGINIGSILIDGSISACPNINRQFVQGNIYTDSFSEVWMKKFKIMRNRRWAKTGVCEKCNDYLDCNGGAMHLRDENLNYIGPCCITS